ncbi:MAG TPA: DUF5317 family protein [Acidimicrobiales bacterium]|nr:DUF5317 family protein [Acidimicrobiales bacterium]
MGFTSIAVVVGLALALAMGGRPANVADQRLRWLPALVAGAALQLGAEVLDLTDALAMAVVAASYLALGAFAVVNLRLVGMPVVLVGLALNALVIGVNGGMPVRGDAIRAIRDVEPAELAAIDFGAKRHLEGPDDRLTALGDIIPVPPLGEVLSFGDLVLAVGVTNVVFRLLRPRRDAPVLRQRPGPGRPAGPVVVLPDRGPAPATPTGDGHGGADDGMPVAPGS